MYDIERFSTADLYYLRYLLNYQFRDLTNRGLKSNDPEIEQVSTLLGKIELIISATQKKQQYIDI